MQWSFTLWGRPPTTNRLYQPGTRETWRNGAIVNTPTVHKASTIREWQDDAIPIIRTSKPSRWSPPGFVIVHYWPFSHSDMDAGNVEKALCDAIVKATGVDDAVYLPRAVWKTTGVTKEMERVEVVIEDAHTRPGWWPIPQTSRKGHRK